MYVYVTIREESILLKNSYDVFTKGTYLNMLFSLIPLAGFDLDFMVSLRQT